MDNEFEARVLEVDKDVIIDKFESFGAKGIEIEVSDFDKTNVILKKLGYNYRLYQENKRIRYYLNGV